MMDTLIVLAWSIGSPLAYLAIGMLYGRSQSLRLMQLAERRYSRAYSETLREMEYRGLMGMAVWLWPFMIFRNRIRSFLRAPIERHEQRIAELETTREQWIATARDAQATPELRSAAVELAAMYAAQIDELKR